MTTTALSSVHVVAVVGEDTSGVGVISASNPFLSLSDGRRAFSGFVAASASDTDRIRRIVAVSAGCAVSEVEIVSVIDASA